jgi:hypothetical protein
MPHILTPPHGWSPPGRSLTQIHVDVKSYAPPATRKISICMMRKEAAETRCTRTEYIVIEVLHPLLPAAAHLR